MIKYAQAIAIAFTLLFFSNADLAVADKTLVSYGSEDSEFARPADGLYIFENARGFVEPSDEYKFSGYRSLELQEAPRDGTFVELQGVVPPVETGYILFHFAIFVLNPEEELNIALAGPAHFTMQPNGIALWLQSRDGVLYHHTDAIPKRLLSLEARTWYLVDVVLNVEAGTYDLRIVDARLKRSVLLLKDQKNAVNRPKSRISKLSFIGDLEDRSNVHYFVDDVELRKLSEKLSLVTLDYVTLTGTSSQTGSSQTVTAETLIRGGPTTPALGELDAQLELQGLEQARPQCLPATSMRDFGIEPSSLIEDSTLRAEVKRALTNDELDLPTPESFVSDRARAIVLWRRGCRALAAGNFDESNRELDSGILLSPHAEVIRAAKIVVAHARGSRAIAESELSNLYEPWATDARLPVLIGMLATAVGNHEDAFQALNGVAERLGQERSTKMIAALLVGDASGFDSLQDLFGDDWKNELDQLYIANSYYLSLVFTKRFDAAVRYAQRMETRYSAFAKAKLYWIEREADGLVYLGERERASSRYNDALRDCHQGQECLRLRKKLTVMEQHK